MIIKYNIITYVACQITHNHRGWLNSVIKRMKMVKKIDLTTEKFINIKRFILITV